MKTRDAFLNGLLSDFFVSFAQVCSISVLFSFVKRKISELKTTVSFHSEVDQLVSVYRSFMAGKFCLELVPLPRFLLGMVKIIQFFSNTKLWTFEKWIIQQILIRTGSLNASNHYFLSQSCSVFEGETFEDITPKFLLLKISWLLASLSYKNSLVSLRQF